MFLHFPLQVSAALAGNFGGNIDASAISALGSESTGLSTGQINMIKPGDLFAALDTLSSVSGWNGGQAKAIIQALMGVMEVSAVTAWFIKFRFDSGCVCEHNSQNKAVSSVFCPTRSTARRRC